MREAYPTRQVTTTCRGSNGSSALKASTVRWNLAAASRAGAQTGNHDPQSVLHIEPDFLMSFAAVPSPAPTARLTYPSCRSGGGASASWSGSDGRTGCLRGCKSGYRDGVTGRECHCQCGIQRVLEPFRKTKVSFVVLLKNLTVCHALAPPTRQRACSRTSDRLERLPSRFWQLACSCSQYSHDGACRQQRGCVRQRWHGPAHSVRPSRAIAGSVSGGRAGAFAPSTR